MRSWFEANPERLRFELDALTAAGIRFARDAGLWEQGKLRLRLEVGGLALIADFPDLYPYFRFEVFAPTLSLERHQHPFSKALCLIGRATENWKTTDTLAAFLLDRLPSVLGDPGENKLPEEPQAEPASDYFPYQDNTSVLVDSSWLLDGAIRRGHLTIGISGLVFQQRQPQPLRGAVLAATDRDGNTLVRVEQPIQELFHQTIAGEWYRTDKLPLNADPGEFLAALTREHPSAQHQWTTTNGDRISIIGVLFREELQQQEFGDGWLFHVRAQPKHANHPIAYFARASRAGQQDMQRRIPELAGLHDKRVALVGLGCIGAPSAVHFARNGVGELRVLDCDFVEPGASARWPLGLAASGMRKPDAIKDFLAQNYPFTVVVPYYDRIGDVGGNDCRMLEAFLGGADLLYDASAERGVNHALSDLARSMRLPYVSISSTPGGWGGRVIRIRPDKTVGCWICALHHLDDGSLPTPPGSEDMIQPEGCGARTFTGAGFDVEEVSLMGVRTAVSTLCSPAYPEMGWDVAISGLRDDSGALVTPWWRTFELARHPACRNHEA